MGTIFSKSEFGVERIFDGSVKVIDLRKFTETTLKCNVFYTNGLMSDVYLFIYYLKDFWYLGKIVSEKLIDENNPNESIILTNSGRQYLIHKNIPFYDIPENCKELDLFITNTK